MSWDIILLLVKFLFCCLGIHVGWFFMFNPYSSWKRLWPSFWYWKYIATCFLAFWTARYIHGELTITPEEKVARAESIYQAKKKAIEDAYDYKLREAKAQVKLAEIEAKQRALYNENSATNIKHDEQLAKAQAELSSLQAKGADYSKLSQATISSSKSEPVNEQTKLILSALWLGACFFLQRLFERLFHDKGYALLTVCAAGFLLAFFTANYFLLGGSVTGGIMGSVGDRV